MTDLIASASHRPVQKKRIVKKFATFAAGLLVSFAALSTNVAASEGGHLLQSGTDLGDRASLQSGAKLFMNYCSGCHSLKYLRYSRMAEDLGLTEEEVMNNLNFTGAKFGEQIQVNLTPEHANQWFGKMPPDLSLIARVRGSDWVYTYLNSFYLDESRPLGWNNKLFPNASMPNVLWELQGLQHAEYGEADKATGRASGPRPEGDPGGPAERRGVQKVGARHHRFPRIRQRTGRPQAPEHRRLGDPVPGLVHHPGLPAEARILAGRGQALIACCIPWSPYRNVRAPWFAAR